MPDAQFSTSPEPPAEPAVATPARKRPKPGERRVQILEALATMLEQPGSERQGQGPSVRDSRLVSSSATVEAIDQKTRMITLRGPQGDRITFRPESEINDVTLVIRSDMKNDLKFGNKVQVYDCIDEGRIKVFFGTSIKEIRDDEVVLMNARTEEVRATIPNDYIFAMIGGDRPTKFLEAIGVKIG